MKRTISLWTLIALLAVSLPANAAMSISKMRVNSRFLTDRMAHELGLTTRQYEDVYEVNYDFINNVRYLLDDAAHGDPRACKRYYDFLDVRNDDLRWILSAGQYRRFLQKEHFYRPVVAAGKHWQFRIYQLYTDVNFFYFGRPRHYTTYRGGHYRTHFGNVSYYQTHHRDHYRHETYTGPFRIAPSAKPAPAPHRSTARPAHSAPAPRPHQPEARPRPKATPPPAPHRQGKQAERKEKQAERKENLRKEPKKDMRKEHKENVNKDRKDKAPRARKQENATQGKRR